MKLVVQNLTGSLFYVQVEDDATVFDLKREISAQQNLPSDRLIFIADDDRGRLISDGDDEFSLVDCGVRDGSHIYIFFCPLDEDDGDHAPSSRQFFFTSPDLFLFE